MKETANTVECPFCAEDINPDSTVCPHCDSVLVQATPEPRPVPVSTQTPEWAAKRLQGILTPDEEVIMEFKGRVDVNVPTGIGAMFWWIRYILVNVLGVLYTLLVRKTAWMVLTNQRIIILTNQGINFPFWVIQFSRTMRDYIIYKDKLASINAIKDKVFWFVNSRGFIVESVGGLTIIFNGMKEDAFLQAKSKMLEVI